MAAAAANNAAALREAYPPPPSLFNLYGPDDGVSPLPPPPPPIPTPEDIAELRERKIELNVLGNPLRLVRVTRLAPGCKAGRRGRWQGVGAWGRGAQRNPQPHAIRDLCLACALMSGVAQRLAFAPAWLIERCTRLPSGVSELATVHQRTSVLLGTNT